MLSASASWGWRSVSVSSVGQRRRTGAAAHRVGLTRGTREGLDPKYGVYWDLRGGPEGRPCRVGQVSVRERGALAPNQCQAERIGAGRKLARGPSWAVP